MKVVAIGAAPTSLGVAYRLNELKNSNTEEAVDLDLLILEQVDYSLKIIINSYF